MLKSSRDLVAGGGVGLLWLSLYQYPADSVKGVPQKWLSVSRQRLYAGAHAMLVGSLWSMNKKLWSSLGGIHVHSLPRSSRVTRTREDLARRFSPRLDGSRRCRALPLSETRSIRY